MTEFFAGILASLIALFGGGDVQNIEVPELGGPTSRLERTMIPETDSVYFLGTSSPSVIAWARVIADAFYDTDASDGCATFSSNLLTSTGVPCGSGGGGGGFWATTTNNLIIYPTSDTYTVSIGANATTSSEFWFDPNTSRSKIPYASTTMITATTASTTNLIVSGLNSASCDVKASTAGVLSCGTDATGGASDYDAWTHPGAGESATTSSITIDVSAAAGNFLTLNAGGGASADSAIRYHLNNTIANWVAGVDDNGDHFGFAFTTGGAADLETNRLVTILNTGNLGVGTTSPYAKLSVVGETVARNFTATSSSATSTFTNLVVSGNASTTNLVVSGLNAASCDVKASTAGVLSCGTDATGGGGGTPDSKWATSTDFAIYPSGTTNSLIVGRTNQLGNDCLICSFATSSTGTLIFASSSSPYDADNFHLYSSHNSLDTFYISAGGDMFLRDDATFGGGLTINSLGGGSTLLISGSASTLQIGTAGVTLTDDGDGALTFTSFGDTNNEDLTVNLDDTADTAVWTSSTGVNNIDWSAITKSTFTNASTSLFSTTYGSTTDAIIGRTLTLFGTAYTTLAGLGNALVNAVTAVTPTGTWDFGGATFLEIPNGTGPTADDPGEIAHDTTDNQLIVDDFVIQTTERIWGVTIASTSPAFVSAGLLPIPNQLDGYTVTRYQCHVTSGTSKVIAVEDASANSSEDITCATTNTTDDGSITNGTFTASELGYIDFGATNGAVDYVTIEAFGTWTRE